MNFLKANHTTPTRYFACYLQIGSEETENDISTPVENERKQKYLYLQKEKIRL